MAASERLSKSEILGDCPLFENLLPPERAMLADLFSVREYAPGNVIFNQGDVGDTLYVIASGSIDIMVTGFPEPVAVLDAPQFFGEMSLIDKEVRSAAARASKPTVVLELTSANLHLFAKNFRNGFTWVVVNIARALSSRMRAVNAKLAQMG